MLDLAEAPTVIDLCNSLVGVEGIIRQKFGSELNWFWNDFLVSLPFVAEPIFLPSENVGYIALWLYPALKVMNENISKINGVVSTPSKI